MILIPFVPYIGGGGVVTVQGNAENQAFYWELVSLDPMTGEETAGLGTLAWSMTRTDASFKTTNLYQAPTDPNLAGRTERIRVRRAA